MRERAHFDAAGGGKRQGIGISGDSRCTREVCQALAVLVALEGPDEVRLHPFRA